MRLIYFSPFQRNGADKESDEGTSVCVQEEDERSGIVKVVKDGIIKIEEEATDIYPGAVIENICL